MGDGAPGPERGDWAVGIDFGTAFSKVAATPTAPGAERQLLPLHIGKAAYGRRELIVPSALFLHKERIHFGPRAIETLLASGEERREALQSFKTILGAEDFERAIDMFPLRSVDPTSAFKLKELIVLYLAYLLELMSRAAPSAMGPILDAGSGVRLRYSRPGWIPRRAAEAHNVMETLFAQAAGVRARVGSQFLMPEGLPYPIAKDALAAAPAESLANLDGGVYEASAVAACHFVDPDAPNYLMVVDIGGGTTDLAGFARDPRDGSVRVLPSSRVTIPVAGDAFDRALMHVLMGKAGQLRSAEEEHALWRNLLAHIRELKERLFEHGQVEIKFRSVAARCTAREFLASSAYREAARAIGELYQHSLARMAKAVRAEGGRRIGVVLAGGGAFLPSTNEMVRKTKKTEGKLAIEVLPTTPAWANDMSSANEFARLFAQMCVAFGTAIAGPTQIQNVRTLPQAPDAAHSAS